MRYLLLSLFICLGISLQAQKLKIRQDSPILAKSVMFGFETGGSGGSGRMPDTGERFAFHNYRVRPRLTLFPIKNLGIGVQAEYEWAWTHIAPLETYYGYGAFVRYYWGSRAVGPEDFRLYLHFFAEYNYNRSTNPALEPADFSSVPAPLESALFQDHSLIAGVHFRLMRRLMLEIGWGPHFMPIHPRRRLQIGGRVGLDVLFGRV